MREFEVVLQSLVKDIADGRIEVYNEFSVQHELGLALRAAMPDFKVQFERNIGHFSNDPKAFTKREIDIVAYRDNPRELELAVELKFPRNGQYPETMFSFCKDIAFLEEMHRVGFRRTIFVAFAEDRLFYEGNSQGIYGYFRAGKPITGTIRKPTGKKNSEVTVLGSYEASWNPVLGPLKCMMLDVRVAS